MIIKSLKISDGLGNTKEFNFGKSNNIVHSYKNSTGKTTFLRSLLYALGFSIPNTKRINFSDYWFEVELTMKGKQRTINRHQSSLTIDGIEYCLPAESNVVISNIFDIENRELINNLLGCIYVDQEKGWTLLNRGTIIGKNKFYIERFLRGLNDKDFSKEDSELARIESEIKKYKQMLNVAEYQRELNEIDGSLYHKTYSEELENKLQLISLEENNVKNKIAELKKVIDENNAFIKFIEKMNLYVLTSKDERVRVSKENIDGLGDIVDIVNYELKALTIKYGKIKEKKDDLMAKFNDNNALISVDTILQEFDSYIAKMPLNSNNISSILRKLQNRKKEIDEIIKENTKLNNQWVQYLYDQVMKYAGELDMTSYIENKDFIFTDELASLTGTVLYDLVFIFRLAYVKALSRKCGIKFPIIIDSPSGREVRKDTVQKIINLLESELSGHQIIMATINDFKYNRESSIIEMSGQTFDF